MKTKGLIQIYTGDGKGKTTAAIGLAIRALSHRLKVYYVYFYKNPNKWKYGELEILKRLGVKIFGFAKKHPYFYKNLSRNQVRQECLKAMEFIRKIYQQNKCAILILDEILISLRDGFLKEAEILDILNSKPEDLELILTGRGATKRIIEKADLVSEMKKIKHPYDIGVKGRRGIEY